MSDRDPSDQTGTPSPGERFEFARNTLGKPVLETASALIYNADCQDLLPLLNGIVDLTVTSPPYNIGKEYEESQPVEKYLDWCEQWIRAIYDSTMPNGSFWLNLGYLSLTGRAKAIPIPYLLWDRVPFFLLQEVVWHYGAGVAARATFSPRNEKFLWYVKDPLHYKFNLDAVRDPNVKYPNQRKNGKLKVNPLGKNPGDVWVMPKVTSGAGRSSKERMPHPAQFPVSVIDRIVLGSSNAGDLIVDPFFGSGTVGEVALRRGRRVIGIEINSSYVGTAVHRLNKVSEELRTVQGDLFS